MAIEKTVVEQGLESRGLDITLADNFTFETEDLMNSTLDTFKPRTFGNIEDVMKDENLSKMIRTYGDKRLSDYQSKADKDKNDKDKDKDKNVDKDKDKNEVPDYIKKLNERLDAVDADKAKLNFDSLVDKTCKAEDLGSDDIDWVKSKLKPDAAESDVKDAIKIYKAFMAKKGIKEFSTPGSGGKSNSSIEGAAKSWVKKNTKNKK